MANRTGQNLNLPNITRQSVPVEGIPQVNIPLLNGGAQRLVQLGAITHDIANTVSAIDEKNQEMAAEKQFTTIFLDAQKEIQDYHATASASDDISGNTLAIYDKYINGLESNGLSSRQSEIIRTKLQARQADIGQSALNFELNLKAKKYDEDLNATIDNAANIVASEPALFNEQLKSVEALIGTSRLNDAEKTAKLANSRQLVARVYLSRLSEINPAKARAEANSSAMNGIIDPQFKTSLLGKLDAEQKAQSSLALQDDIKSIEQARRLGVTIPTDFITKTAQAARSAGNERSAAALEKYATVQDYSIGFSQKSLADQQLEMRELTMKAKLGDLADLDKLEAASAAFNDKITAIKKDPWGYYAEKGIIPAQEDSVVGTAPDAAQATLASRRMAQETVKQLEGGQVNLPLLTPTELSQLSNMKDTAHPKELASILVGLGSGMNGAERTATVAAVAQKEPLLAIAMGQDMETATRLLAGRKTEGEVSKAKVREKAAEALKGITLDAAVNETMHDAIFTYYKQLALEKGDTSKEAQADIVQKTINDVVGNVVSINTGKPSRIIAPAGMTANQVEDKLSSITDEALTQQQGQLPMASDGTRATAQDILRFGRFISAGNGLYAVQLPTGTLYRDNGQPYTIDINRLSDATTSRTKTKRTLDRSRTGAINANQ